MASKTGRPSKGAGARSVVRSVRLTPAEKAQLEAKFGTVAKALRHLVDGYLYRGFRSTKSVPGDDTPDRG